MLGYLIKGLGGLAQLVERKLAKLEVGGSIPLTSAYIPVLT